MQNANPEHTLILTGRSAASITGVEDVECFNEQIVILRTPLGALTVSGASLNISQLNLGEGRLMVEGEIDAIEYSAKRRGRGFFGRLMQ